jgi:tetratricopeptide (TPR) repeat protein
MITCLTLWGGCSLKAATKDPCVHSKDWNAVASQMPAAVSSAQWPRVESLSTELTHVCPEAAPGFYWLGVALLRQERTFPAVRTLRKALQLSSDEPTHLALAEGYFLLKQHKFFDEEIDAAISAAPQDPEPYYVAGRYAYQVDERFDVAAGYFEKALARDPAHYKASTYLALSLKGMNRTEDAEARFLKTIQIVDERKAQFDLPFQLLASLYMEHGRARDALPYIQRAVQISPGSATDRLILGQAAWALGDAETAQAAFERALALDDGLVEARYSLAQIYKARGEQAKAQTELKEFETLKELYGRPAH